MTRPSSRASDSNSPEQESLRDENASVTLHENADGMNSDALSVYRVVVVGLLLSLLWRVNYFYIAAKAYIDLPIQDTFFPAPLQWASVSIAAYGLAIASLGLNLFTRNRYQLKIQALVTWLSLTILCLHQHSFNDMIFHATWWTSLWGVWMAWQLAQPTSERLIDRAAFLSHVILSVVFLGAGIGKATAGYWSGEVMFEIFFADRNYWFFNLFRDHFDEPALRTIACWYSRMVMSTEIACGAIWLLPKKLASFSVIPVLCGIALFSSTYLFSVVSCLLALALVGLHEPRSKCATF